jgi:hypothetical protein
VEGNVNHDNNTAHLRDKNNANWTMLALTSAIGMCIGKDGIFGEVVVGGSYHDRTVRPRGQWEGGIALWGGGVMTMMKVKNNDDDEANAKATITTTPETTMTVCVVDDSNCRVVDCQLYCQF